MKNLLFSVLLFSSCFCSKASVETYVVCSVRVTIYDIHKGEFLEDVLLTEVYSWQKIGAKYRFYRDPDRARDDRPFHQLQYGDFYILNIDRIKGTCKTIEVQNMILN